MATKPVDFRKGAEGLAALVREQIGADPFCGTDYVFRVKRTNRLKLIFWGGTGMCLFAKRLEDGEFRWPKVEVAQGRRCCGRRTMTMTADQIPDDPSVPKAMVLAREAKNARLRQIIKELQRHRFGRRAETLSEDQLLLGFEDADQIEAAGAEEAEDADPAKHAARTSKRRTNRGALPAHLPRVEQVVDIDDHVCACCHHRLHRIGEDVSERLDIVPAQLRVIVVRWPKYTCRTCEDVIVQAAAPTRLTEGGLPTEATIAPVLVSKYAERARPLPQLQERSERSYCAGFQA